MQTEETQRTRSGRGAFIKGMALAGLGAISTLPLLPAPVDAQADASTPACGESVRSLLSTALIAEHVATTFYYAGLTSFGVMHNQALGGSSTDPNNPGLPPNGSPGHVRYLQAALDAEAKHAALLAQAGAISPHTRFYFPPTTFATMGNTLNRGSFLGVMDVLETLLMGLYIAASADLMHARRHDLALLTAQMMGVEAEHRTLGRVIANVTPANSLTLEQAPFGCADEAAMTLQPFLTGTRYLFAENAIQATPLPTAAQVRAVVRSHGTRRVRQYL